MSIVFLLLTSAAAGDEDLWLEVDAAAFDIVAYAVAVLLRREPGCHPFTSIDAQSVSLNAWRVFVFSLASLTVSSMLPPHFPRQGLQRLMNFGALSRGFSTCCLRFKNRVATTPARLASGWLARLYREGVEPSGSLQKVSDHISRPPFLDLSWRKGRFILNPPSLAVLFDHLVGAGEERRRTSELFPPPLSSVPCLPLHAAARYHDPSAPGGNGSFRLAARRQRQRKISHCQ